MSAPAAAPFGPDYGFGLYIHWPYCARICPYCDFNVYAAKARDHGPLMDAIIADIVGHRRHLPGHPLLDTVFFGGGTPSLMPPADIERLLDAAAGAFGVSKDCEVTLEANPNDVLSGDPAGWRAAGVTRLSIGLQSLDDDALAFLGRDHDAAAGRDAVGAALKIFESLSIDLIYARPDQSEAAWREELRAGLALQAPHLSLYELTIEARTAFGKRAARGDLIPMDDDAQADLYALTQAETAAAGLPAYEISNHAAGAEHRARHNMIYWRGGDWIGAGPGAHGRLSVDGARRATEAARRPADYIAAVRAGGVGWDDPETLAPVETARELLAMGLREASGLDLKRLVKLGADVDRDTLADLSAAGLVAATGGRLSLSPSGRLLADRIAALLAS